MKKSQILLYKEIKEFFIKGDALYQKPKISLAVWIRIRN